MSAAQASGQTNFTPGRENAHDQAITELLSLITKPPGARYHFGWQNGTFVEDDASGPYSESALRRADVAEARERDRNSRKGLVLWWKSIDGFDMDHFERVGRRLARQVAVDGLAQLIGVERGAALIVKPDEELRRKIRLFKNIQATREAAFEFTGKGKYSGEDVPLRLGLGGLQDFTPSEAGRENSHKRPKGYAPWRPHKKTTRLMFQVKQILDEYRDHLPLPRGRSSIGWWRPTTTRRPRMLPTTSASISPGPGEPR